jgi:hypothetical protein
MIRQACLPVGRDVGKNLIAVTFMVPSNYKNPLERRKNHR